MFLSQQAQKLHQMVKDGQKQKALDFISSHSNSDQLCELECPHDGTLLHVVAKVGDLDLAKVILEKGVKVDRKVAGGLTPLHCSVKGGHLQMTEFLVDRGADINFPDQDGRSPLLLASIYNRCDVARSLIDWGAEVDTEDDRGQTALMHSILRSDFLLSELLVLSGADVNKADANGQTALHYAAEWDKEAVASLLLARGADVNATDDKHQTALHLASSDAMFDVLLDHGADDGMRDKNGRRPRDKKLDKEKYKNIERALAGESEKAKRGHPTHDVKEKVHRVFSPGPPVPETELRNAKSNMLKELQVREAVGK